MLYVTIVLFLIAAIFGVIIFKNWLTSANTSKTVIYAHGAVAAIALVILLYYVIANDATDLQLSLWLFVIAALGGFYMFYQDMKKKFSPMWMAVVHALLAVAGVLVLVFYTV